MKTHIQTGSIIAGCMLMAVTLSAQTKKMDKDKKPPMEGNFTMGMKGGVQFSSFSRFAPINTRIGWNAGMTMTYSAWEHWGVGGDMLFVRSGGYYSVDRASDTRQVVRTDYVRFVPKVTYFFMNLEDRFRPKIFAGPNFGVLTMAKDKNSRADLHNEFRDVEIGLTAGLGFNYRLARAVWLNFDAEYLVGFNRINKVNTYSPDNLHTNSMSASIGLVFGLNRLAGN